MKFDILGLAQSLPPAMKGGTARSLALALRPPSDPHVMPRQSPGFTSASDRGALLLIAALFFVSILAHRLWRGKIRAEDEREALRRDLAFSQGRYRTAFRTLALPAAFADRATGLVMETTPGWAADGLPAAGTVIWSQATDLEAAWKGIPAPAEDGRAAEGQTLLLGARELQATPLSGESLGVVLLECR